MSKPPINIDEYCKWVTIDSPVLRDMNIPESTIKRLERIRAIYSYWLQFPSKLDKEIVTYEAAMFKVQKSQAYEDIRLVQLLIGNINNANKEFMRWKINMDLEQDLRNARRASDYRAVAAIEKARIMNNRTDKDDEPELEFEKIVPQTFEPSDDPSILGIQKVPDLRGKIRKLIAKYSVDTVVQDAEYEELKNNEENGHQPSILQ